ncbi:MAG: glycosyltransferase family 39 protein [Polyangiaceae bacterium]|nr:glycosyltransferase family 39 protein [Polyangiaceae bacterium]
MTTASIDGSSHVAAERRVERIARAIAALSCAFMAVAGGWELAGPVTAGHYAIVGSRGIMAENMLTWGIWGPVRTYTLERPPPTMHYANHPWGMFWLVAASFAAFGRHEWACRLVPLAMSVATPALLFGVGRALWGPVGGALAAAGFVVLPITLSFAAFPGFEVPVTFGCALALWGYVHLARTWSLRWMLVSLLGFFVCYHADWIAYLFAALVLGGLGAVVLVVPRRWIPAVDLRRFLTWWAAAVALAGASLALYAYLFQQGGHLDHLSSQAKMRSTGNHLPLEQVLQARRHWIEIMFTPLAILVGKATVPLVAARAILLRRPTEALPLAVLAMALFHYVYFKNGADVHIFWPYPFAAWFALGLGALGGTIERALQMARARWLPRLPAEPLACGALAVVGLIPLAIVPDGLRALRWAHATGGRLNDDGHLNQQDVDKAVVAGWVGEQAPPPAVIGLHSSMRSHWGLEYALHRPIEVIARPRTTKDPVRRWFLADSRFASSGDLSALAAAHAVRVVGPFWVVDSHAGPAPLEGLTFEEREPSWLEAYFVQGNDPLRTIRPDAYVTWELRHLFGQEPNPPPTEPPRTRDQRRIAHNLAVAAGDAAAAREHLAGVLAELRDTTPVEYTGGTKMVGRTLDPGVAPKLTLVFMAGDLPAGELQYDVRSMLDEDAAWSLVPRDDKEKQHGTFFALPPASWKKGHVYFYETELRRRPGRERFYGFWFSRGGGAAPPVPTAGPPQTTLLVLPP